MTDTIRKLLADARVARNERRMDDALQGYREAAERARQCQDALLRAQALRHVSDIAREQGQLALALAAGTESVTIFRGMADAAPLDLANALRVAALALQGVERPAEAVPLWREARPLYASVDVASGVQECEANLPDETTRDN